MNESDELQIMDLMFECFDKHDALLINGLLKDLFVHPAGLSGSGIVAVDNEKVIGFVMLSVGLLDTFEKNIKIGVLGPLGVHPHFQKQGIARKLVSELESEAEKLGLPLVFLEGDPAFYSKLDYIPAKSLGNRKPSIRIPDVAFQCKKLMSHEDWMKGTLVYPEPFWTNDCVGLRETSFIEWVKSEVSEGREL